MLTRVDRETMVEVVSKEWSPALGCRSCSMPLGQAVIDLGMQPLSNAYLREHQLNSGEAFYPLRIRLCTSCALLQTDAVTTREDIFHDAYAYFSSYSHSWLQHARAYAERMQAERQLTKDSFIVEVASNDGYLLRWFATAGFRVRGIDPARECARAALQHGVETTVAFLGRALAENFVAEHGQADIVVANNVLAHVPDLNDFVSGIALLLAPQGLATFEFPHLMELVRFNAFDTIYHEHYCYLSVQALQPLFERHGLVISDVERLSTHGGSLRLHVTHRGVASTSRNVYEIVLAEQQAALHQSATYVQLNAKIDMLRVNLLRTLIEVRERGEIAVAYGAAAKGNTLLNTLGIGSRFLRYVVDRNPHKIGSYMPGSHLPIVDLSYLERDQPSWILVLPWNLSAEIAEQLSYTKAWGAHLYRAIPDIQLI